MKEKFRKKLLSIPPPGGNGCHTALLGAANVGAACGYSRYKVFNEIKNAVPHGTRNVSNREIWDAVNKAFDEAESRYGNKIKNIVSRSGEKLLNKLLEKSPVKIPDDPTEHPELLLKNIYKKDDQLFIGSKFSTQVKSCGEWLNDAELKKYSLIIPNPLTGKPGLTKNGRKSFRADSCVKNFRFAIAEFDSMSIADQAEFWLKMMEEKLPVSVIIHSGGKSLHAWLPVRCRNRTEWDNEVEQKLFPEFLIPLGIDGACKNESRMSRFPGHYRFEAKNYQYLVYLNKNA